MSALNIEVCPLCRGPGIDRDKRLCPVCGGSGYPPGYTPPTRDEVLAWLRLHESRRSEEFHNGG